MAKEPLVVGFVGGICAGNSRVAEAFARRGARVISGEALAHEALRQPEVKEQSSAAGAAGCWTTRERCNVVFWPPWFSPTRTSGGAGGDGPPVDQGAHPRGGGRGPGRLGPAIVLDAAVMLEAGRHDVCDRLVFIEAPREARLRRVAGHVAGRRGAGGAPEGAVALDGEGRARRSYPRQLRLSGSPGTPGGRFGAVPGRADEPAPAAQV